MKVHKTKESWGKGISTSRYKDVFIYRDADKSWWVWVKVGGALNALFAHTIMVSEGKRYISFDDAYDLAGDDMKSKLLLAKSKCEKTLNEEVIE